MVHDGSVKYSWSEACMSVAHNSRRRIQSLISKSGTFESPVCHPYVDHHHARHWPEHFGTVLGTLTEQTGAVIPDTPVTLANIASGSTRETATNDIGFYQFVNVPPGSYRITVARNGFETITREPVNLQIGASLQINLVMEVGSTTQTVIVNTDSPLINVETDSTGTVIDQRATVEIPLNGRNPMNLVALVPGVIAEGSAMQTPTGVNPGGWGDYQIGGGMAGGSMTYLDGQPLNTEAANYLAMVPTQDSLQEFKVETNNLGAEWGRTSGGVINFSTKSGSNQLHGNTWEYIRNKVLNANTFFNNSSGIPRGAFTQNQYGFNVGGPVLIPRIYDGRQKTFFFFDWEGFSLRQGATYVETVPTAAERGGDLSQLGTAIYDPLTTCGVAGFPACTPGESQYDRTPFAGGVIPSNRLNATALAYLKEFYPQPNTTGTSTGLNNFINNTAVGGIITRP